MEPEGEKGSGHELDGREPEEIRTLRRRTENLK
jgi:hypothetical protein